MCALLIMWPFLLLFIYILLFICFINIAVLLIFLLLLIHNEISQKTFYNFLVQVQLPGKQPSSSVLLKLYGFSLILLLQPFLFIKYIHCLLYPNFQCFIYYVRIKLFIHTTTWGYALALFWTPSVSIDWFIQIWRIRRLGH